ncbi:transcriptional regulator, partial [Xenorhabdus bovienii]|nr:transcriptional regulator [Xenorhabdus bovienii]
KILQTVGIPVVELMDSVSPCLDIAVGIDNFEAARQMTMAMIKSGCQNVVYLGARQDERTLIRLQGFEVAMRSAGLQPRKVMTPDSSSYSLGAQL